MKIIRIFKQSYKFVQVSQGTLDRLGLLFDRKVVVQRNQIKLRNEHAVKFSKQVFEWLFGIVFEFLLQLLNIYHWLGQKFLEQLPLFLGGTAAIDQILALFVIFYKIYQESVKISD